MVKNDMKKCRLTIITVVDGQENSITREGEMELSVHSVRMQYAEENAVVRMQLQGETAEIERRGDYSLRLRLEPRRKMLGEIGIGGAFGEVETFTHTVQYSVTERSVLIALKYDLIISGETQAMQLRLLGRYED